MRFHADLAESYESGGRCVLVEGEDAKAAYKAAFKLLEGDEIVIQLWVDNKGKRGNRVAYDFMNGFYSDWNKK